MKYILFCLAAICFAFSLMRLLLGSHPDQDHRHNVKSTTLTLSKSLIDVGERKQHSVVKASYVIYNSGPNDLYIQSVVPDCHCTVANFSSNAIKPKDSSILTLNYDAAQTGAFQSSAVITTNTDQVNTLIIFRGYIVP